MQPLQLSLFGALCTALVLGVIDHRSGFMPNRVTLPSLALALLLRSGMEGPPGALSSALGAFLTALGPAGLFYFSKGEAIGGGDVKALAAIGAWLGPILGLEIELLSFLLLTLTALVLEAQKKRVGVIFWGCLRLLLPARLTPGIALRGCHTAPPTLVRFGPYLALGTLLGSLPLYSPDSLSIWDWLT